MIQLNVQIDRHEIMIELHTFQGIYMYVGWGDIPPFLFGQPPPPPYSKERGLLVSLTFQI